MAAFSFAWDEGGYEIYKIYEGLTTECVESGWRAGGEWVESGWRVGGEQVESGWRAGGEQVEKWIWEAIGGPVRRRLDLQEVLDGLLAKYYALAADVKEWHQMMLTE